jgi:lycopene cyclase domain-containing protein
MESKERGSVCLPRLAVMTYFQFHLIFNLPALLLLLWLARGRLRAAHGKWFAAICGVVMLFTTPWDNWAVYKGIWDYDWSRVTAVSAKAGGIVWRLPAEEYAFFLIEAAFVALVTVLFLPRPEGKPPA